MKKFLLIVLVAVILLFTYLPTSVATIAEDYCDCVLVYTKKPIKNNFATSKDIGGLCILEVENCEVKNILKKEAVLGISFSFDGNDCTYKDVINRMCKEVKFEQNFQGISTVYGYTPNWEQTVNIDNEEVNIQIAFNNGKITVGCPLILGSY
ncbi:MAG: YwmB family TATA-box binding protein [Clostridia bacterium]